MQDHYNTQDIPQRTSILYRNVHNASYFSFQGNTWHHSFRGAISVNMSRGIFIRSLNSLCQTITEMTSIRITNNPNGVLQVMDWDLFLQKQTFISPQRQLHICPSEGIWDHMCCLVTSRWINITNYPKQTVE